MGITLSPDGNKIFVAACYDGPNLSYKREPFSAMGKIKCNTVLDNLELDTEGTLQVGAHKKNLLSWGFPKGQKAVLNQGYLNDGNSLPFYFF